MIQLYINNHEIVLPDDLEIDLIDNNPLITDTGEYSLDITISLLEPKNAIAFGHLYRVNKTDIPTQYDARLLVNMRERNGIGVLVNNTETEITLQLLFGNSSLNYIAGDRKIWELDWGSESPIDYTRALSSIIYHYDDFNFFCTPVKCGTIIFNDYNIERYPDQGPAMIESVNNICMQPKLMYYINLLPQLLGFTLKSNVLANDVIAKLMYLINHVQSLHYADALPDMTINEFIEAVETFFNVIFLVNTKTKELNIISLKTNYNNKNIVTLTNILDSYSRDYDQSTDFKTRIGFTKVSYNLSESNYMRYAKLNQQLLDNCEIRTYANLDTLISAINPDNKNKHIIYIDQQTKRQYVYTDKPQYNLFYTSSLTQTGNTPRLYHINKLNDFGVDVANELVLNIVPTDFEQGLKLVEYIEGFGADAESYFTYNLPTSNMSAFYIANQDLLQDIEKGQLNIPRNNVMKVGLYAGMIPCINFVERYDFWFNNVLYPWTVIDSLPEFIHDIDPNINTYIETEPNYNNWLNMLSSHTTNLSMRLDYIINRYQIDSYIDMSIVYEFDIEESDSNYSVDDIYIINNQRYIPIKFERKERSSSDVNISKIIKGYFFKER